MGLFWLASLKFSELARRVEATTTRNRATTRSRLFQTPPTCDTAVIGGFVACRVSCPESERIFCSKPSKSSQRMQSGCTWQSRCRVWGQFVIDPASAEYRSLPTHQCGYAASIAGLTLKLPATSAAIATGSRKNVSGLGGPDRPSACIWSF